MAATILTIPAEILLKIVAFLDLDDLMQLRYARKGLFEVVNGVRFNQEVAKVGFPERPCPR